MLLMILGRFLTNTARSSVFHWGRYVGDSKKYMCKKLNNDGWSLYIEKEAATRLAHLPTVIKVKDVEVVNGNEWLVSDFIQGKNLEEYEGGRIENIFLHVMCTLVEFAAAGITHNDMRPENIIVTSSDLAYVEYVICGRPLRVKVFGFIPVILGFGEAHIKGFKYKPRITQMHFGSFGQLVHDTDFDALTTACVFADFLTDKIMIGVCEEQYKKTKEFSLHVKRNLGDLFWAGLAQKIKHTHPKIHGDMSFMMSGLLASFPDLPEDEADVEELDILENNMSDVMRYGFLSFAKTVMREGPCNPFFNSFCVLSHLYKDGIKKFLDGVAGQVPSIMPAKEWVRYLIYRYKKFKY